MKVNINNKEYDVRMGGRASTEFGNAVATAKKDTVPFDCLVDLYWNSIRNKGKLKRSEVEEYIDDTPGAIDLIIEEVAAFKKLGEEAKK